MQEIISIFSLNENSRENLNESFFAFISDRNYRRNSKSIEKNALHIRFEHLLNLIFYCQPISPKIFFFKLKTHLFVKFLIPRSNLQLNSDIA